MAEEVEIGNVGGEGVASEVTLAKLTAAIENMARASGVDPRSAAAKLQEQYNKSLGETDDITSDYTKSLKGTNKETKKTTKNIKKLGQASMNAVGGLLGSVLGGFTGLAKEFVNGGNNLSDFAQHIPIVGGLLGGFAGYIDNTVSTFRTLSATGAAFGNDMMETRRSAGQMGLSLDEFAGLISNNASNLAALGGSVTQGAERFKKMNANMKSSGDFAALKSMGFTVEEVNEGMGDYIDLQRRMGTLQGKSTAELATGSADYLKQIDLLAKVTGKTREEAEKALREQAADAAIRGMMNQFEEGSQELKNFQLSLGIIEEMGGATGAAMKDLLDGMPSGPETAQFLNMMGDAGPAMQDALKQIGDGADPQVLLDAMKNGGGQMEEFANMDADARAQYIASIRQQQPAMAEFLDNATRMIDIGGRDLDAAKKEQDSRDKTTKAFTTFEDAIRDARGIIQEAFVDSGIFEGAGTMVKDFSESIAGIIKDGSLKETMNGFFDSIKSFVDNFKKFGLIDSLFGKEAEIDESGQKIEGTGVNGLFDDLFGVMSNEDGPIMKMFNKVMDTVGEKIGPMLLDVVTGAFSAMWEGVKAGFAAVWDNLLVGAFAGIGVLIGGAFLAATFPVWAPVVAAVGGIVATFVAIGAAFGWEPIKGYIADAWESIKGVFTSIGDWWDNLDLMAPFTTAWNSITGIFTSVGDWWDSLDFMTPLTTAWDTITSFFSMDTLYSISDVFKTAWETVTGFFSFGGEGFSISNLASDAWKSVTSWFSWQADIINFSISTLASTAWETVKGFFTWGQDTIGFSISGLLTTAWEKVKSAFSFGGGEGEEGSGFSISGLLTTAWETITGFFSFGDIQLPSIKDMFQGIIDTVKGFFSFDFKLPNFKSFLPTWLGGEGKSLGDGAPEANAIVEPSSIDATPAVDGANSLMDAQSAMASFSNIDGLQNNLEILKSGLDTNAVRSYTDSMKQLVAVLGELNAELAKDNKFGIGTGENAGSVLSKMDSIGGGGSSEDVNNTLQLVLAELRLQTPKQAAIVRNTKNGNSTDISRSMPSG